MAESISILDLCRHNLRGPTLDIFILVAQHHPGGISKLEIRRQLGEPQGIHIGEARDHALRATADRSLTALNAIFLVEEHVISRERKFFLTPSGEEIWQNIIEFVSQNPIVLRESVIARQLYESTFVDEGRDNT